MLMSSTSVLYAVPAADYLNEVAKVVKANGKSNIIYVSTNRPADNITKVLKGYGAETENIFFIDCASHKACTQYDGTGKCICLESPSDIMGISIALTEASASSEGSKIVLLDSVSTMLIYNSEEVICKFFNFMINKMRVNDVSSVLFVLSTDMEKTAIKTIEMFVDEVKK